MSHQRGPAGAITCIVVDHHPDVLEALGHVLPGEGIDVVARATTGAEAIEVARRHVATIILVDLVLPDTNGIDLARRLAETAPALAVVLYAGDLSPASARPALEAGIRGIVLKKSTIGDLVDALRVVAAGGVYVDPLLDERANACGQWVPG